MKKNKKISAQHQYFSNEVRKYVFSSYIALYVIECWKRNGNLLIHLSELCANKVRGISHTLYFI